MTIYDKRKTKELYEKAIDYVRENKSWSKACEEYALETIGEYRCPIEQASEEIYNEIIELMDDYGRLHDFPEGWWCDFGDTDEIFFEL